MTNEFHDLVFDELPSVRGERFDSLWDTDTKDKKRKWNRHLNAPVDADMYEAVQDLVANPKLPFGGSVGDFLRHSVASTIASLEEYLNKDIKILWSVMQATQRRLTAERFVVTAEEQVKAAVELLEVWTTTGEWNAIHNDLVFHMDQIRQMPQAGWRRRVANEWMNNQPLTQLMAAWEEDMQNEAADVYNKIAALWGEMYWLAQKG